MPSTPLYYTQGTVLGEENTEVNVENRIETKETEIEKIPNTKGENTKVWSNLCAIIFTRPNKFYTTAGPNR